MVFRECNVCLKRWPHGSASTCVCKGMTINREELTIEFDTQGGSSVLGRLVRLLAFPFVWVATGKAKL